MKCHRKEIESTATGHGIRFDNNFDEIKIFGKNLSFDKENKLTRCCVAH